jgi:ribosomal protein S27E
MKTKFVICSVFLAGLLLTTMLNCKKEATIYYWPSSVEVFCSSCGEVPFRQFLSSVVDEEVYAGSGNPYAF